MSKVTVTVKPATDAAIRRDVASAYTALAALEPTAARLMTAATRVGALRGHGMSVRAVVEALSIHGEGVLPTGKGTVERLGYVADALLDTDKGTWPEMTTEDKGEIVKDLYRIAQTGKAADVARAGEAGRAASSATDAIIAVAGIKAELNVAQHKGLTATAARQPAIGAQGGDTDTDTDTDGDTVEPTAQSGSDDTGIRVTNALAGAGTLALIAELTRRVGGRAFTADAVLSEAFDQLAAAWEERVSTEAALDEIDA